MICSLTFWLIIKFRHGISHPSFWGHCRIAGSEQIQRRTGDIHCFGLAAAAFIFSPHGHIDVYRLAIRYDPQRDSVILVSLVDTVNERLLRCLWGLIMCLRHVLAWSRYPPSPPSPSPIFRQRACLIISLLPTMYMYILHVYKKNTHRSHAFLIYIIDQKTNAHYVWYQLGHFSKQSSSARLRSN